MNECCLGIIKSDSEPSHCLFRIDVIDASIVRNDIFYAKAINYAIMAGAAALIQIALSKKQMEVRCVHHVIPCTYNISCIISVSAIGMSFYINMLLAYI